ncbi:AAA domain-containing protein [Helicobacter sp. MIT 14-3879]|uniref:AAA domain-containing protein n=1 Tax=Helicobacter sp. MIT 14-3879 TaxID=2040649 RepID=UPI000E1ECBC0|nr:AAA domain-containing protein [Helicobacter sp. MIT 14-3879]RDU60366.1 hypothetical protein CQA44_10670 [Helicobacter sp. MIT 14-3879]
MSHLHDYIINSAREYLNYLEEYNLGIEKIKIFKATLCFKTTTNTPIISSESTEQCNTIVLVLEQSLFATDYLQLYIGNAAIDLDSIEKKNYNELTRTLSITFEENTLQKKIRNIESKANISISSNNILQYLNLFVDLKFLVKNILSFCQQKLHLALPSAKPIALKISLDSMVSNEQKEAIKGIFSHPISYIWGISGSGKTQIVLFSCLLNIISQQKRALILAPTNTALEQIFISLIKKCDAKGILRSRFLRLGMPSNDFLQHYPEVCLQSDDEESDKKNLKQKDTMLFATQNLKERLQDCYVVGLTLDSFVKRYQILSMLDFVHIFLDECAFSPLIKIIPPLHLNIPLTLLGDHKQLMPICLMNEAIIKSQKHSVCLWSLSTLFLESMLQNHIDLHHTNNHDSIQFQKIAHYKLTTTHRYGNNLAQILDKYIYHNGLQGRGATTEVYYIDSKSYGEKHQYGVSQHNESIAEANAIVNIIRDFRDYGVLTPFRDQQKLLIAKGIPRNHVFTIHKSQGKEFDTIIFSPVKFSKYMTDSYNQSALFTLNVAISRLKRELILVCDYDFWIRRSGQLICSLLQIAKPYNQRTSQIHKAENLPF